MFLLHSGLWYCSRCAKTRAAPKLAPLLLYGEGGLQNGRGGARDVLPLRKGGAQKVLAMLKGGHKKFWGSFDAVA